MPNVDQQQYERDGVAINRLKVRVQSARKYVKDAADSIPKHLASTKEKLFFEYWFNELDAQVATIEGRHLFGAPKTVSSEVK